MRIETRNLLSDIERSANRKLWFAEVLGDLVDAAVSEGRTDVLMEAAFLAKFVTRSLAIMKRIGVDGEGYEKLQGEAEVSLAKASTLVRSVADRLPQDARTRYDELLFSMTQENMKRFVQFLEDLTALKNWTLDGGALQGSEGNKSPE